MSSALSWSARVCIAAAMLAGTSATLHAQDKPAEKQPEKPAALPDGPAPAQSDAQRPKTGEPVLTEDGQIVVRKPLPGPIAGDAIFAPLATGGPDTLHRKTLSYVYVAFGPKALVTPAIGAAFRQIRPNKNYPPEWQRGIDAFGRNYGSAVGTKTAVLTARYAVGAALHEDFRYRPTWGGTFQQTKTGEWSRTFTHGKSDKSVPYRIFYAIGFTFVDRSDSGHYRLALANLSSAAAGGYVGNLWLPDGFNDATHGATRMGSKFGSFAFQNVTREFSPEIIKTFKALHLPMPGLHVPEWWTKTDRDSRRR